MALVAKIQEFNQPVQPEWVKAQVRAPGEHRYVSPDSVVRPFAGRTAAEPAKAAAGKKRPVAVPVKKAKAPASKH
jgi:hypothetical protein